MTCLKLSKRTNILYWVILGVISGPWVQGQTVVFASAERADAKCLSCLKHKQPCCCLACKR
uniref:Uncharacterized protein n=1 Tax=Arundo donax TaxID=35708 RepID=A0A0A9B274_ARUDO